MYDDELIKRITNRVCEILEGDDMIYFPRLGDFRDIDTRKFIDEEVKKTIEEYHLFRAKIALENLPQPGVLKD